MARHTVCRVQDLPVGEIVPVNAGRARLVLSRLKTGEVKAYAGRCPHQGAYLEFGCISGLTEAERPNEVSVDPSCSVLRCPWHGFEFSLENGQAVVADDHGRFLKLRPFDVQIEGDDVIVVT